MLLASVPTTTPTIAERVTDFRTWAVGFYGFEAIRKYGYYNALRSHIREVDTSTLDAIYAEYFRQIDAEAMAERIRILNQARGPKTEPRCGQCGRPFDSWREAWDHESRAHAMENDLFARVHR
jgi:hypothetical protein